jgi:nucleoside-diphosphate-sugar epimerase
MRILVTGHQGFLMQSLIPKLEEVNEVIYQNGDVRNKKSITEYIDMVIHFASPSDSFEFEDKKKTAQTIIDGTINMLDIAREHNAHFVYASSGAMFSPFENPYGLYKRAMSQYIEDTYDKYTILVIPRVYGVNKTKGLMKKLREDLVPEEDMDTMIEFWDIDDWVEYTLKYMLNQGYLHYHSGRKESIKTIKELYI